MNLIIGLFYFFLFCFESESSEFSLRQLELKDGKVLELRIFIKVADKFLQVETMDGKKMQFRPEDISEREHQRRFGVSKATIVNPRTETTSPVATDKKQLKFRLFPHLIPILYWRDSRRLARSYRRISKLRIS